MNRRSKQKRNDDDPDQWYFAAAGRWSSVRWSQSLFKRHLSIVHRDTTRHPEDVFLSGAAGFQIDDAWSVICEEYSSEVVGCLRKMRVPGQEPYDLWAQALERLLKESTSFPVADFVEHSECVLPPTKIVEFEGRASLKSYLILIAQNIGRDHLKRKEVEIEQTDVAVVAHQKTGVGEKSELNEVELKQVQFLLRDGFSCLTKNEKCVLKSIGLLGMSNLEVSAMQGYSASTATRYRQSAIKTMNRKLKQGFERSGEFDDRVMETALSYFQRILQSLSEDAST